jgi:ParB family chromosome partitioning protein
MVHRKALGRGISALIPGNDEAPSRSASVATSEDQVERISVSRVLSNPLQPRTEFDDERLEELASSIRQQGIIQPIVVRARGTEFELIAGERRLQAARRAGLSEIPAIVRDIPDERLLEFALIENIQRENLNPIDEARAYQGLIEQLGLTQQTVADRVGKDRATVANYMRLLNLPDEVRSMVATGKLSPGHARALLSLEDKRELIAAAMRIVDEGLTVRAVEEIARTAKPRHKGRRTRRLQAPELLRLEEELSRRFMTRARVKGTAAKGTITLEYYSQEELERLMEEMNVTI